MRRSFLAGLWALAALLPAASAAQTPAAAGARLDSLIALRARLERQRRAVGAETAAVEAEIHVARARRGEGVPVAPAGRTTLVFASPLDADPFARPVERDTLRAFAWAADDAGGAWLRVVFLGMPGYVGGATVRALGDPEALRVLPGYLPLAPSPAPRPDGAPMGEPAPASPPPASTPAARAYYTGPRGGCYYLTASGRKQYVDHSFCGR